MRIEVAGGESLYAAVGRAIGALWTCAVVAGVRSIRGGLPWGRGARSGAVESRATSGELALDSSARTVGRLFARPSLEAFPVSWLALSRELSPPRSSGPPPLERSGNEAPRKIMSTPWRTMSQGPRLSS